MEPDLCSPQASHFDAAAGFWPEARVSRDRLGTFLEGEAREVARVHLPPWPCKNRASTAPAMHLPHPAAES